MGGRSANTAAQRCAVYTRVSMDKAEDDKLSSVQAQFMARHELIASQFGKHWVPTDRIYEDRGYLGSNNRRPGLQELLSDVVDGLVDIVVVHRLDRLSRHLGDFNALMHDFERHGVPLVSGTQSNDTSSPQGRLMLNVLLSFAQFEREVTGERIRDKIAASKRKGIWVGGVPSLGYDVVNRKLVINQAEAAIVQRMFTDYPKVGSTTMLVQQLRMEGVTPKSWVSQTGKDRVGKLIDKGALYKILNNPIYAGDICHKGVAYPGEHEAIITRGQWELVQATLASKPHGAKNGQMRTERPALLKGLI